MNAAFGSVSAGGIGTPEFEVTHSGGGPCAFVAVQSGGNVGGVTASKFSLSVPGFHMESDIAAGSVQLRQAHLPAPSQ